MKGRRSRAFNEITTSNARLRGENAALREAVKEAELHVSRRGETGEDARIARMLRAVIVAGAGASAADVIVAARKFSEDPSDATETSLHMAVRRLP